MTFFARVVKTTTPMGRFAVMMDESVWEMPEASSHQYIRKVLQLRVEPCEGEIGGLKLR